MTTTIFIYNNNANIFEEYVQTFSSFLKKKKLQVYVYCQSADLESKTKQLFPKSKVFCSFSNSKHAFIHFLHEITKNKEIEEIDFLYKIETVKSEKKGTEHVGFLLQNWPIIESFDISIPYLFGANSSKSSNNKLFHRQKVVEFIEEYNLDPEKQLYKYVDEYNINIESSSAKSKVEVNPDFYSFYEQDLKRANFSRESAMNHWKNHGIKESHRVSHPAFIKSFGSPSFYISNEIFAVNKAYLRLLQKVCWSTELNHLENKSRCFLFSDTFFGILPYLHKGKVLGLEAGQIVDDHNNFYAFDTTIYQGANKDMEKSSASSAQQHFFTKGWTENKIYSLSTLYRPQAILNRPEIDAEVAFFFTYPVLSVNEKKLECLIKNNFKIDVYVSSSEQNNYYKGFYISPLSLEMLKENLPIIHNSNLCNIFLGSSPLKTYKCGFCQEGIKVERVTKQLNLKVLKFLNEQTLVDFIEDHTK